MTQMEILQHAMAGISAEIEREEEINAVTKMTLGRVNNISVSRIRKLEKEFAEVMELLGKEEQKERAAQ